MKKTIKKIIGVIIKIVIVIFLCIMVAYMMPFPLIVSIAILVISFLTGIGIAATVRAIQESIEINEPDRH